MWISPSRWRGPCAFWTGRFDVGNKLDYLRATIEIAIDREDLGEEFRAFLIDIVQREKLL